MRGTSRKEHKVGARRPSRGAGKREQAELHLVVDAGKDLLFVFEAEQAHETSLLDEIAKEALCERVRGDPGWDNKACTSVRRDEASGRLRKQRRGVQTS